MGLQDTPSSERVQIGFWSLQRRQIQLSQCGNQSGNGGGFTCERHHHRPCDKSHGTALPLVLFSSLIPLVLMTKVDWESV